MPSSTQHQRLPLQPSHGLDPRQQQAGLRLLSGAADRQAFTGKYIIDDVGAAEWRDFPYPHLDANAATAQQFYSGGAASTVTGENEYAYVLDRPDQGQPSGSETVDTSVKTAVGSVVVMPQNSTAASTGEWRRLDPEDIAFPPPPPPDSMPDNVSSNVPHPQQLQQQQFYHHLARGGGRDVTGRGGSVSSVAPSSEYESTSGRIFGSIA